MDGTRSRRIVSPELVLPLAPLVVAAAVAAPAGDAGLPAGAGVAGVVETAAGAAEIDVVLPGAGVVCVPAQPAAANTSAIKINPKTIKRFSTIPPPNQFEYARQALDLDGN